MRHSPQSTVRILAVLFLVLWIATPTILHALPPAQRKLFDAGVHYYDIIEDPLPVSCSAGGSVTSLAGSTQEEKVFNFFISKGLSAPQAAGIMGNLMQESGYDPFNQQNGSSWPSGGWGIAQWTGGRRDTLRNAVLADPKMGPTFYRATEDIGTTWPAGEARDAAIDRLLLFQLNYLYNESVGRDVRSPVMPGSYSTAPYAGIPKEWDALKKAPNVEEAVIFWEWNYERAGDPQLGNRLTFANNVLTNFGSNPAGGAQGGVNSCGSGQTGDVVMPVDRRHYTEHEVWFTKTHHDYPAADIPVPTGTPVYSMTAGTIIKAPTDTAAAGDDCGLGVLIDAGNGVTISYCHGSDGGAVTGARQGDRVTPGQLIMHSASTGNSSGPHLHLGIRVNGEDRCPQTLFTGIMNGNPPAIASLPNAGCTH